MFELPRCSNLARLSCRVSLSRTYSTAPNQAIINVLQRCLKEEDSSPTRNGYKVRSFQAAIAAIHEHDKPIRSGQEAIKLRGIGLGIANRIDFFLQGKDEESGKQAKARLLAVETFQKIPGIGERTATNLVNAGAASVSDLDHQKFVDLLTPSQKVSVRYRDHLTRPVPLSAAEEIAAFIRDHISTKFEVHLTGAYRRDAPDLPDVTVLLHHHRHIHIPIPRPPPPDEPHTVMSTPRVRTRGKQHMPFVQVNPSAVERQTSPLLQDVVRPLDTAAILAATLSSGPFRWRGVALLPLRLRQPTELDGGTPGGEWQDVGDRLRDLRAGRGTYVRLDLCLAPLKSRGAAQLALTGDDEFLRIARLAATRQGMHLNEYGLWRWHPPAEAALESHSSAADDVGAYEGGVDDDDVCAGYWELVEGKSEARILDELALGWIPPARRNFRFLTDQKRASARAGTLDLGADPFAAKRGRGRPPRSQSVSVSPDDHSDDGLGAVAVGAGVESPEDVQVVDDVWVGTTKATTKTA